jgi:hypothetical protein
MGGVCVYRDFAERYTLVRVRRMMVIIMIGVPTRQEYGL